MRMVAPRCSHEQSQLFRPNPDREVNPPPLIAREVSMTYEASTMSTRIVRSFPYHIVGPGADAASAPAVCHDLDLF